MDPAHGTSIYGVERFARMLRLAKNPEAENADPPSAEERYYSGFGFLIASDGLSPITPPWSSLTAYDLNTGDYQVEGSAGRSSRTGCERHP